MMRINGGDGRRVSFVGIADPGYGHCVPFLDLRFLRCGPDLTCNVGFFLRL
jgi:hypothetical protein